MVTLTDPKFFGEQDVADFKTLMQKAAQETHALNPAKPRERHSKEIRLEILRLTGDPAKDPNGMEGSLPRWKRQLSERRTHVDETKAAIKRTEQTIAELREAGAVIQHSQRLRELLGYEFRNKFNEVVAVPGVLDQLKTELSATEARIESLETAVKNTEAHVKRELPKLQEELKAALKRESLQ
jgi:hypothetical protein